MGIVKWIVAGVGLEVGSQAAREGIEAVRKRNEPLTPAEKKKRAKQAAAAAKQTRRAEKAAVKAAAKTARLRVKAKKRADKAVDDELAALKKQVEREG